MPRTRSADSILSEMQSQLEKLVGAARREGRADALAEVRALVGGTGGAAAAEAAAPSGRGRRKAAGKKAASKKPRKNPWANMTPEQKKDRVRKMLAGRGLTPKGEK